MDLYPERRRSLLGIAPARFGNHDVEFTPGFLGGIREEGPLADRMAIKNGAGGFGLQDDLGAILVRGKIWHVVLFGPINQIRAKITRKVSPDILGALANEMLRHHGN